MSREQQASRTAAEALAEIARSSRRTARASVFTAVATTFLAIVAGFGLSEYVRLKWALASASAELAQSIRTSPFGANPPRTIGRVKP